MPKIKKEKQGSVIAAFLKEKQPITKDEAKNSFKISFQYLDTSQKYGSSFKDWQKCGLLSRMLETFHGYSKKPLLAQIDGGKFALTKVIRLSLKPNLYALVLSRTMLNGQEYI